MLSRFRISVGCALLAVSVPLAARDLVGVTAELSQSQRGLILVDLDTIKEVGAYKRGWVFTTFKIGSEEPHLYNSLMEVDCSKDRYRYLQTMNYNADHSYRSEDGRTDWSFAPPSSRAYASMQTICGKPVAGARKMGDIDPFVLADRLLASKP